MIKALILDLDNTIYPARAIADHLFAAIEHLMDEYRGELNDDDLKQACADLSRIPFQKIADKYNFADGFKEKGVEVLKHTTYDKPIRAYDVYRTIEELNIDKYLVTFGFVKLQNSKVDMLGIRSHFKEVFVVDPEANGDTKKDVFARIMQKYNYQPQELLVIGDDPESEIKAGKELGIPTYLFDPENRYPGNLADFHEKDYQKLKELLK